MRLNSNKICKLSRKKYINIKLSCIVIAKTSNQS